MAGRMQTATIPCRGGLNLSSNNQELLARPNEAIRLTNFECSKEGGYRRISGYEPYGTAVVPGTDRILGIRNYKGMLVMRNDKVFHSFDGTYWVQVNFDSTNVNEATMLAGTELPRTGAGRVMTVDHIHANKQYVFMVDGKNNPGILSITGDTRATAMYRYKEIVEGVELLGAQYCTMYKNQLVLAGFPHDPSAFYYSSHATTDLNSPEDDDKEIPQENFNGSTSGFVGVGDKITGIKVHREALYVFCETSIHKVVGTESGQPQVTPVTRDIGCVDGFSVQEVGGDLVFLAPDGLRTIAKTERNDDIELGVISRKVSAIVDPVVRQKERYEFNSTVIREKNQYRLWFTDPANADAAQRGIIAAYTYNPKDNSFSWDYSALEGLGVSTVDNSYIDSKERIVHGNKAGEVHVQERGGTFDGARIYYVYQSPYTDFGDISIRKNMHKVFIMTRPEGDIEIGMELRYDYESSDVHQPEIYPMETISKPAIFGNPLVTFNDPLIRFGARDVPDRDIFTEGSGFTVSFRVVSLDTIDDAPFDIQSLQVDLTPGGKI